MSRYLVFALFLLFSCNNAPSKAIVKPVDLIPEVQMVQIIADVHLLEAALNVRSPQVNQPRMPLTLEIRRDTAITPIIADPNAKLPLDWYNIFKKYNVTKKQYETSMKWYASQPEVLNGIYDEVVTELTKRQLQEKSGK